MPDHTFDVLLKVINEPNTKVFIITGRAHKDIDRLISNVPIDIIAEHGAMIKEKGLWRNQMFEDGIWKKAIIPILNQLTGKCPGSFIEEKFFSVAWHYRNAEDDLGYSCSRELIGLLEQLAYTYNLKILDGKKVVEALSAETGKGRAVKKLFDQNDFDFVLSIGDDATDEEMFEFLLHYSSAFTFKVGEGATNARYKFNSINDVVMLLKHLFG